MALSDISLPCDDLSLSGQGNSRVWFSRASLWVHALSNTDRRKFAVVHRLDRRDVSRLWMRSRIPSAAPRAGHTSIALASKLTAPDKIPSWRLPNPPIRDRYARRSDDLFCRRAMPVRRVPNILRRWCKGEERPFRRPRHHFTLLVVR